MVALAAAGSYKSCALPWANPKKATVTSAHGSAIDIRVSSTMPIATSDPMIHSSVPTNSRRLTCDPTQQQRADERQRQPPERAAKQDGTQQPHRHHGGEMIHPQQRMKKSLLQRALRRSDAVMRIRRMCRQKDHERRSDTGCDSCMNAH